MLGNLRRWIIVLIIVFVVTLPLILIAQTFLLFKNYQVNKQDLELRFGKEEERKKKLDHLEQKEKEEQEWRQITIENEKNKKFNTRGKFSILERKDVPHSGFLKGPEGIECNLPEGKSGTLIYSPQINEHFAKIMQDIVAAKNNHDSEGKSDFNIKGDALAPEKENDDYSPWLKRNNSILYGTPGTGKTVFVQELVHHLYQEFGEPLEDTKISYFEKFAEMKKQINEVEEEPDSEEKIKKLKPLIEQNDKLKEEYRVFINSNKIPPVIQINGSKVNKVAGLDTNSLSIAEMIVKIIEDAKHIYFDDKYSNEPYIVFFEEADEMGEMIGKKEGNYLKDIKEWLSTSKDAGGLSAKAQDLNSIVIAATNHFDKIEPGAVRRGRLGKDLNFDWNPNMLKEYSEAGGTTSNTDEKGNKIYSNAGVEVAWPKINWPKNDFGWIFEGNADYPELAKLCEKMGYSVFKDKFAPKTIDILADYEKLKKAKSEKLEAKAKKELGKNVPTGKKVPSGRKKKKPDGSEEDVMVDEMVCNWLLHFLHTFHYYNGKNQLHLFNTILQVRRYGFDNEYLLREEMQNIYHQIGLEADQIGMVYDIMRKVFIEVKGIKDFMAEAHNLRQEVSNLRAAITDNEKLITTVKDGMTSNLRILENRLDRVDSQSASSTDVSNLNNRISALERAFNNLGSAGESGGSGNTVSMNAYNKKIDIINDLNDAVSSLIRALNRGETSLKSYIDKINEVLKR